MKNITASILLIMLMFASLSGATYAWFIAGASVPDNVFTAGTVELEKPVKVSTWIISEAPGSNFAFVPNSAEATVSKVDLVNGTEVARYSTIPDRPGTYTLPDYRVARLAIDSSGNAWALNTMTGSEFTNYNTAQGSIARISASAVAGEVPGTTTSNSGGLAGIVLPDVRVSYYNLGEPGDGPRTINVVQEGGDTYLWIGFHLGKYFQKFKYDAAADKLVPATDKMYVGDYTPYYSAIDNSGRIWVSSRNANPYPTQGVSGVFYFDSTNPGVGIIPVNYNLPNTSDNNPYSVLVDSSGKIWISDGGNWTQNRVRHFAVYTPGDPNPEYISSGSSQAMRGFTEYMGAVWATTINGQVLKGEQNGGSWSFNQALSGLGELAGIGADSFGKLWVVRLNQNAITGFNPNAPGSVYTHIGVGAGPYAYDSFTTPGSRCIGVEWKLENSGSKKAYIRINPEATLDGAPVNIELFDDTDIWQKGSDGWWYYGDINSPLVLHPKPDNGSSVTVRFKYCFGTGSSSDLVVSLEAEAVQWSNDAIDHEWPSNPWN